MAMRRRAAPEPAPTADAPTPVMSSLPSLPPSTSRTRLASLCSCVTYIGAAIVILICAVRLNPSIVTTLFNRQYQQDVFVRRITLRDQHLASKWNGTYPCHAMCNRGVPADSSRYTTINRVSNISISDFHDQYLYQGRPVIVTDVLEKQPDHWPIARWHLSDFAKALSSQLVYGRAVRDGYERTKTSRLIPKQRGLRLWETWHSTTFAALYDDARNGKPDAYYYGLLGIDFNETDAKASSSALPLFTTLYTRGLYTTPYFIDTSDDNNVFVAEWLYIGRQHTGITPHIDHACTAKWSMQIRGRKEWRLAPSVSQFGMEPLQFVLQEGEVLVWWPDQEHSTTCLETDLRDPDIIRDPQRDSESGNHQHCISIHGYIDLPLDNNCYVQHLIRLGLEQQQQHTAPVDHRFHFVNLKRKERTAEANREYLTNQPPLDYLTRCPPYYRDVVEHCEKHRTTETK